MFPDAKIPAIATPLHPAAAIALVLKGLAFGLAFGLVLRAIGFADLRVALGVPGVFGAVIGEGLRVRA